MFVSHCRWMMVSSIGPSLVGSNSDLSAYLFVHLPAVTLCIWVPWNKCTWITLTPLYILTLEARLSFFMACIIPRRPWQPDVSLRVCPAAGELSWDATSELGMILMLSGVLSSMLGSAPFRQLKVFRLLWGGVGFNSAGGAKETSRIFKSKKGLWLKKCNSTVKKTRTHLLLSKICQL